MNTAETTRNIVLDEMAMEQAILNHENETEMDAEFAAKLNIGSLRNERERRLFKHAYRRHARNIINGNPFYSL